MRKTLNASLTALLAVTFTIISLQIASAQCSLAVTANVNLSLSPTTCTATLTPTQVLVSQNCPGGNLVFQAFLGGTWVTNPTFTYAHVNQTISYRVRDLVSGTFAQGSLLVQDKSAPVILCGAPVTVNCGQSCNIALSPAYSDCDPNLIKSYVETVTTLPCFSPTQKSITRTYKATDAGGNTATCNWTITVPRSPLTAIVFPAHVTLQVNGSDCSPWCENTANLPAPSPTVSSGTYGAGAPTLGGVAITATKNPTSGCNGTCVPDCAVNTTYADALTTICGTNRRIDRTWTVTSVCGGSTSFVQRISVFTDGNTTCGQLCYRATSLTHTLPTASTVRFQWTAALGCPKRYLVYYRFKALGVWTSWMNTTTTGTFINVTKPTGTTQGEFYVVTECNGVNSTPSSSYGFIMLPLDDVIDRNADGAPAESAPSLFPNPAASTVYLDLKTPSTVSGTLKLFTSDGRMLSEQELPAGTLQVELDVSNQPEGLYICQVRFGEKMLWERVVVAR